MSSNPVHYVELKAKDGLTQVFITIGRSAATAATQITTASKSADAGLKQVDAAAVKAKGSITGLGAQVTKFSKENAAAGVAIASIIGFLGDATRAAAEEAAGLDRLEQAVTNTGAAYEQYAAQIDAAVVSSQQLSFADDEAVNALNTLTAATQDTEQALQLLSVAQDLARGKGISLAQSAEIIGKVAAGNTGILGRYGIVLDDTATSTEALAAIQQRFAGQSERFADTQAGQAQRLKNDFDNLVESIGANTGELQGLLTLLPGATAGFQLLGGAIGGLSKVAGPALKGLTGSLASLITLGLNPVTIAFGAVALAAGVAIKLFQDHEQATRDLAEASAELNTVIGSIEDSVTAQTLAFAKLSPEEVTAAYENLGNEFLRLNDFAGQWTLTAGEVAEVNRLIGEAVRLSGDNVDELVPKIDRLTSAHLKSDVSGQALQDSLRALTAVYGYVGTGSEKAREEADRLVEIITAGGDAAKVASEDLNDLAVNVAQFALANQGAVPHVTDLGKAVTDTYAAINTKGLSTTAFADIRSGAQDAEVAVRNLESAIAAGKGFGTEGLSSLTRSPGQAAKDAAALEAVSEKHRAEMAADAQRLAEEQAAAAEEARDARIRAAEDYAQAEEQLSSELTAIERERLTEMKAAQRDYSQEVRSLEQERVDQARSTNNELRDLEIERRDVALETEQQIKDLAEERGNVQIDLAKQAQDAEAQWLQTSRENLQSQAQLRSELQRTTAEAAREWQQLNAENLAAQQAIQEALRDTLKEGDIDFRRSRQDNQREQDRIKEDLAIALADPDITEEEKFRLELEAERQLADLKREAHREQQDHRRAEKQAREAAAEEEQRLEDERKAAAAEFEAQKRADAQETNARIAELEKERQAASAAFAQQQRDQQAAAAEQLAAIDERQRELLEGQAQRFAELEREKQIILRDSAREQEVLARQAASAQEKLAREQGQAERERLQALTEAQQEFADQQAQILKDAGGAFTEEDFTATITADTSAIEESVQDVSTEVAGISKVEPVVEVVADTKPFWAAVKAITSRDNVGTATILVQGQVIEDTGLETASFSSRQAASASVLLGSSRPRISIPAPVAADSPTLSRGGPTFLGPVTFVMQTPNIAREINRTLATRGRG